MPADAACSMTNLFQRGDVVVFRMWGVHVTTGGNDLTNVTVKKAYVKVPGLPAIPLVYGTHPTKPAVSYWTAAWPVGKTYPLGVVNYSVTVITNPVPDRAVSGGPVRERRLHPAGLAPGGVDAHDRAQQLAKRDKNS